MKQVITKAIVLGRTNYQEADRILTLLTPDQGKIRVMARGVRKERSKLAAGVELFSVSEIGFMRGRGEIDTLTTSRLKTHFGNIVKDIERTMLGYELIKRMNRLTEDAAGPEYFELLTRALDGLDTAKLDLRLLEAWFNAQLLKITGHAPGLNIDVTGEKLAAEEKYIFDIERMLFAKHSKGTFNDKHIKLLRLVTATDDSLRLLLIMDADQFTPPVLELTKRMLSQHLHI